MLIHRGTVDKIFFTHRKNERTSPMLLILLLQIKFILDFVATDFVFQDLLRGNDIRTVKSYITKLNEEEGSLLDPPVPKKQGSTFDPPVPEELGLCHDLITCFIPSEEVLKNREKLGKMYFHFSCELGRLIK